MKEMDRGRRGRDKGRRRMRMREGWVGEIADWLGGHIDG